MEEIRYLISDASKKVDVETHVLRYWEEELGLSIPRNEMGHRYYTEFHIHLFRQVKQLKARGYQLKAIRTALQQVMSQNQEFMHAADVLEKDMAQTLQKNPSLFKMQNEVLPEGIMRLADYNRLENSEYTNSKMGFRKNDVSWDEEIELLDKQDLIFIKEREQAIKKEREQAVRKEKEQLERKERGTVSGKDNAKDKEKTEAAETGMENEYKIENKEKIYNKQKIYSKQEIMEKDGQTEMKKKGKNRKKPSAWERRNGVVGKEQEHITENSGKKDKPWKSELEELIAERERRMLRERNLRQPDAFLAGFGELAGHSQEDTFDTIQTDAKGYLESFQIAADDYLEGISDAEDMREQVVHSEDKHEKGEIEKAQTKKEQTEIVQTEIAQTEKNETEKSEKGKNETEKRETEKGETGKKEAGKNNIEEKEMQESNIREIEEDKSKKLEENKTRELENNKTRETENSKTRKIENNKTGDGEENKTGENEVEKNKTEKQEHTEAAFMECPALPPALPQTQEASAVVIFDQEEKMRQFQEIMNHIIGHALEQNNELLSHRISEQVSEQLAGDLEEVIRIRDEREEERFRRLDETIRSCQRDSQGKAEAAAARVPFFKKHRLGRNRHSQSF